MRFLKKYTRGVAGWYSPCYSGEVSFWYGNGRWVYAEEADKRKLKHEVLFAFHQGHRGQSFKVTGRFPNYNIVEV